MPYQIVVDLQHLDDGAEVHIDGLGTFTKGGANLISDEAADAYEVLNITNDPAYAYNYDENGNKVEGTEKVVGSQQVRHSIVDLVSKYQGLSAVVVLENVDAEIESSTEEDTEQAVEVPTEPTYYKHLVDEPVDDFVWPNPGKHDKDGNELRTFFNDKKPGDANGVSSEWEIAKAVD